MLVTIPPPPKEPTSSRLWDEYEDKFFQGINHGCIPSRDKVQVFVWRCDGSFLSGAVSASLEDVMISQLWYSLWSVPTIQHTKMRAIHIAICEEEVILMRTSTRTGRETIEEGGESKKEKWKVKVCRDCE